MLSKNNVIQLYNDGLVIRWRRKKHPQQLKGEFDPAAFEVNVYTRHLLSSEHDRDLTLLHGFIHARDDRKELPNIRTCSPQVEREAETDLPAAARGAGADQGAVWNLTLGI